MGVLSPEGAVIATAVARNKKEAEQNASRIALEVLTKKKGKQSSGKKATVGNINTV
jgi:dsRNA-specific ribonuclease